MIKVDILRASWLSNPVGPSRTLNRILNNKVYYSQRGFDIDVFTLDNIRSRNTSSFINANKSWKYKIKSTIKEITKNSAYFCFKIVEKETFFYGKQLIDFYLSLNREVDIIVFHDIFSCYYYHLFAKKDGKIKTVLFYHNNGAAFDALLYYYPILKESKYLKRFLEREKFVINKIDKLVFIAQYGQNNFLSIHSDYDEEKTLTIHNGIDDINVFNRNYAVDNSVKKYRLVCSGTINQRKGQYIILQALSELNANFLKEIHVTFIGDGPMKNELEVFVKKNNLQDYVTFLGSIDNKDVVKYLEQANIYILMSHEEGLPISVIEAMRSGLGIIATRIAGIPELVKMDYNGVLLDPDKNQLIKVLCNLSNYDWKTYGKNSRLLFECEYTFDKMLQSYCDMLDTLNK